MNRAIAYGNGKKKHHKPNPIDPVEILRPLGARSPPYPVRVWELPIWSEIHRISC